MISIIAGQEFLPTDLMKDGSLGVSLFIIIGCAVLVIALIVIGIKIRDSLLSVFGISGAIIIIVAYTIITLNVDSPNTQQNLENLTKNIKSVYDVEEVTPKKFSFSNGSVLQVTNDGKIYEVLIHVDPETYEPTLSPISTTAEDIENLKK